MGLRASGEVNGAAPTSPGATYGSGSTGRRTGIASKAVPWASMPGSRARLPEAWLAHEPRSVIRLDADLGDRVAVVTGAASGIGLATARALDALGAGVVVADLDEERG